MKQDVTPPVPDHHTQALAELCRQLLPVWARQLASSRSQSEAAVAEMLAAFAEIGPHLDMATRQSQQITAALAVGSGGIISLPHACARELQPVLAQLNDPARSAVQRVLEMVQGSVQALESIAKPFERETQLVGEQVERMYRGFQYQDRISQMMTLLHEDIERLRQSMDDPGADIDPRQWLTRLQSQYVMREQHHHHSDTPGGHGGADDETTFF